MGINTSRLDITASVLAKNNRLREDGSPQAKHETEQHMVGCSDNTPAAEQWEFLQSTDEMSAAITQFYNKKIYEKKIEDTSSILEYVLEEEVVLKIDKILQVAKNETIGPNELLKYVRKLFPDDSDLVLILREIINRKKIDEIVKNKFIKLLAQIDKASEQKFIRSGINCALKAKIYGKHLYLNPKILRVSYREFLLSDRSPIEIYIDWVSDFGYKKRELVLAFIEGSLLCDIHSLDASCSDVEFGFFLKKLCQLQLLRSAEHLFIRHVIRSIAVLNINNKEDVWLCFLLLILNNPDSIDLVLAETIEKTLTQPTEKERLALLLSLYSGFKKIPASLFPDESALHNILTYIRSLIGENYTNSGHLII